MLTHPSTYPSTYSSSYPSTYPSSYLGAAVTPPTFIRKRVALVGADNLDFIQTSDGSPVQPVQPHAPRCPPTARHQMNSQSTTTRRNQSTAAAMIGRAVVLQFATSLLIVSQRENNCNERASIPLGRLARLKCCFTEWKSRQKSKWDDKLLATQLADHGSNMSIWLLSPYC
jgi:hypothetical protein